MRLTGIILVSLLICSGAFAGEDTSAMGYVTVAESATVTNGTINSSLPTNSIANYKGIATFVVYNSGDLSLATTSGVARLQHATTSTGTWEAVSGIADTIIGVKADQQTTKVDLATLHAYVRLQTVMLAASTNDINQNIGAQLVCPRLSQ